MAHRGAPGGDTATGGLESPPATCGAYCGCGETTGASVCCEPEAGDATPEGGDGSGESSHENAADELLRKVLVAIAR